MSVKLLTEHHLEFLIETTQACLSLFMSKYHTVGNHILQLIFLVYGSHFAKLLTRIQR